MAFESTLGWHAERQPHRPAIVMGLSREQVSFAELERRSARLARVFREGGLSPRGSIAIMMENNRLYLEVAWAAQRSGLFYTAINSHLRVAEAQYILDDCGASAFVASEAMAELVARLDLSRVPVRVCAEGHLPGFRCYEDVLSEVAPESLPEECEGREMLYSSGTTGRPKGVRKQLPLTPLGDPLSAPTQIAGILAARGVGPGSVYLSPAPLYHAAPLVSSMSSQRLGATVVVMERFDARLCLELVERHRVTHAQFVPTMFVRMLRLDPAIRSGYDLSSLQHVLHGAAPCPVAVKREMLDWWGPIIDEYYSGTEDVGGSYITAEEWLDHPGSVGRPLNECHIVGKGGDELGPRRTGLIFFAGGRSSEYHNDPVKTASTANERGWRTFGDIGYRDGDGYLYLTDRQDHVIISGGVNIYPQEAENVLLSHPAVADVAVLGVPDPEMGETVKAVVELVDAAPPRPGLEADLLTYCRGQLATYKCPRGVDFVSTLPRDESGKLFKRVLREQYWAGQEDRVIGESGGRGR